MKVADLQTLNQSLAYRLIVQSVLDICSIMALNCLVCLRGAHAWVDGMLVGLGGLLHHCKAKRCMGITGTHGVCTGSGHEVAWCRGAACCLLG